MCGCGIPFDWGHMKSQVSGMEKPTESNINKQINHIYICTLCQQYNYKQTSFKRSCSWNMCNGIVIERTLLECVLRQDALSIARPPRVEHELLTRAPTSRKTRAKHYRMLISSGDQTDPIATFTGPTPDPHVDFSFYINRALWAPKIDQIFGFNKTLFFTPREESEGKRIQAAKSKLRHLITRHEAMRALLLYRRRQCNGMILRAL